MEQEHKRLSIYKSPLLVISYFGMYAFYEIRSFLLYLYSRRRMTLGLALIAGLVYLVYQIEGPHQAVSLKRHEIDR